MSAKSDSRVSPAGLRRQVAGSRLRGGAARALRPRTGGAVRPHLRLLRVARAPATRNRRLARRTRSLRRLFCLALRDGAGAARRPRCRLSGKLAAVRGPRFVLDTAAFNGVFITAPLWVTAILLPLALFGLLAWRGEGSARATLTVAVYLALFLFVGKRFDYYWGALYTPLLMLGLPFLPGAVRDLAGALFRRSPAPVSIH